MPTMDELYDTIKDVHARVTAMPEPLAEDAEEGEADVAAILCSPAGSPEVEIPAPLGAILDQDLQPYDVAAGLLMLSETGHGYRNFAGDAYDPFRHRTFVAGRPGVFEVLREAVLAEYGPLE